MNFKEAIMGLNTCIPQQSNEMSPHEYELYCMGAFTEDEGGLVVRPMRHNGDGNWGGKLDDFDISNF